MAINSVLARIFTPFARNPREVSSLVLSLHTLDHLMALAMQGDARVVVHDAALLLLHFEVQPDTSLSLTGSGHIARTLVKRSRCFVDTSC